MIGTTLFRNERRADRDRADLEAVVGALNKVLPNQLSDEDHQALVDFVELWNRSGRAPWKEPFHSAMEGRTLKRASPPFPVDVMKMLAKMRDEGVSDEDPSSERDEDSFVEIRLGGPGGKRSLQKERTRCSTSKGEFQDHLFSDEVIEDPQGKRFWQQHRGRFSGQSLARAFSWIIIATPAGGWWHKAYSGPLDPAVVLAATLLGNGLSARLSDDPCPRCKKWFIKRRPVQKCCSKRCATAFNNTVGVQSRRAADHERKLDRARAAMKTWKRTERRTDWKVFVSEQAGLTPRFLTRAVNKNELHVPKISKNPEKKGRKT